MSEVFFRELAIPTPDHHLEVGSGSHAEQTARIMMAFEKVLQRTAPDWVVVVATSTPRSPAPSRRRSWAMQVAHVEAGLRSFDLTMPEEINRSSPTPSATCSSSPRSRASRNLRPRASRGEDPPRRQRDDRQLDGQPGADRRRRVRAVGECACLLRRSPVRRAHPASAVERRSGSKRWSRSGAPSRRWPGASRSCSLCTRGPVRRSTPSGLTGPGSR